MDETILLTNMAVMLLLGGICSIIFKKLKMPAVIGYLTTGIILANYWSGISSDTESIVSFLSDLGLVLMMFGIGMELNLSKLKKNGAFSAMVVMIQVPIMLLGGCLFGSMLGLDAVQSIVFGAVISGSSTAVILVVLNEQNKLSHADIETIVLITVIEDVAQVLILSAVTPLMYGNELDITSIVSMFVVIILFMVVAIFVGLMFIPKFLDWISTKMTDEILLVIALGLCFCMSWLSVVVGMSMAIGAFMMGVIVSQSRVSKSIEHDIRPMKDVFMMMFFISIGLEIKPEYLINNIGTIICIYLIYFVLKFGSVLVAYFLGNKPIKLSFLSSIGLIAMGEFAFIISKMAYDLKVFDSAFYSSIVGAALVSIILLPIVNKQTDRIIGLFQNHTPKAVISGFATLEERRSSFYTKMTLASKTTIRNARTKLTASYFNAALIIIVQLVFAVWSHMLADFIDAHTSADITNSMAMLMVLLLNFIVLVPLLYTFMKNVRFLFRVMLDTNRRASKAGQAIRNTYTMRFMRYVLNMNNWVAIILLNFAIMFVTPNDVDFVGHVIVTMLGVAIMCLFEIVRYYRRS
ncbi:MAG: cation:proton antiporter [archaeon]|nr:cation:proton antiporter [archaeon]